MSLLTVQCFVTLYCYSRGNISDDKGDAEKQLVEHITTFYPIVEEEFKPPVGMQFECLKDAFEFYKRFYLKGGLGVCKHGTKELCSQVFVCSKEGHSKEAETKFDGKNQENEINFEGMKKRKRQKEGKWMVANFEEGFSDVLLTPSKIHFIRSHRQVPTSQRHLIHTFTEANIKTCQLISVLEIEARGD